MDPSKWIELAPAYAALIIFVWYTLSRDRQLSQQSKEADDRWEKFLTLMTNNFREDTKARDEHWLLDGKGRDEHWAAFLVSEREQRKAAMEYGMHQVDALAESVKALVEAIQAHDLAAEGRYNRLMEAIMASLPPRTGRTTVRGGR